MAYRRNSRYYYGRARSYARKSYRGGGKNYGVMISPAFIAGAAIGMTDLDNKIPAQYTLAAAAMPLRGKGIGQIKALAQGVIIGNLVQTYILKGSSVGQTAASFGI